MKRLVLFAVLILATFTAQAQHRNWHHNHNPEKILVPVLSGVLIGIAVSRSQQPEIQHPLPIYIPPPIVSQPNREFYPCIIWVPDPRTGMPRQEFATCVR